MIIETVGLSKRYPKRNPDDPEFALQALTLGVRRGSAVALIGPNGAGKSTTLRLAAGIERPSHGTVTVFGLPPRAMSVRRRMGYLSDTSELFGFLDTSETLAFFAAAANVPRGRRRERAGELVERFGLHYGKKRVKTFSAGMRRRLGLACVLIGRPEVLLLDEPVTGLDPAGMELFVEVMRAEKERGTSILFSSHRMSHVEEISDEVVVLRRGKPVAHTDVPSLREAVGTRSLEVAGLDAAALARVRDTVAEMGGSVSAERIPDDALRRYLLDGDGSDR